MNIGLLPIDGGNFPNLALMKVARFYKESGANVEFYTPFIHYFKSTDFKDFQPRKGFKCQQYFNIFKNKKII